MHNGNLLFLRGNKFYNMYNRRVMDIPSYKFKECYVVSAKSTNKIIASICSIENLEEFNVTVVCNSNKTNSRLSKKNILSNMSYYDERINFYDINCLTEEITKINLDFSLSYAKKILDNNREIPGNVIQFYADEDNKNLYFSTLYATNSRLVCPYNNLNYYNGLPFKNINDFYDNVFYLKLLNVNTKNFNCHLYKLENDKITKIEY